MSLEDQVYDRIIGLVLNQIAHNFGEGLSDDLNDALYEIVGVKISYETEILKVLGPDSNVLDRANLIALAELITLEELFSDEHDNHQQVHDYMDKFPVEIKKWRDHLHTLLD